MFSSLRVNGREGGPAELGACIVEYAGLVGEGCGWFGEFPPSPSLDIDAVRCDDALIAAGEGSKLEESCSIRPSCMVVGERLFGLELERKRRFVENFRERELPDF